MMRVLLALFVAVAFAHAAGAQRSSDAAPSCQAGGPLVRVPQLPEASGIAASRRVPGRLWTHKDSGNPVLFALDTRGNVTGQLRVPGVEVDDWEAVAVGPCPAGSCIFIGDIGDNNAHRKQVTIYRFAEPDKQLQPPSAVDTFAATYPDGPHDAEALLAAPDGRLFIVTKGSTGPVALYAFPRELRTGSTMQLQRVGQPREARKPEERDRITDGSVSTDGKWIVLRTHAFLNFYRATELLAGNWREASQLDLRPLREPQGEGVTFGPGDTLYLTGEGGSRGQPGTFAQVSCK